MFLSQGAHNALTLCGPREDLWFGSDHLPIFTELRWEWEEQTTTPRRAWKKLDEPKVRDKVKTETEKLSRALGLPLLDTTDDIEGYLEQIQEGLQRIIQEGLQRIVEKCIPWAKPGKRAHSFWNPACTRVTETAKERLKDYHRNRTDRTRESLRLAEREKVAVIRREKTLHFRKAVDRISSDPKGLWAMAKWGKERSTKPRDLPKFPSLRIDDQTRAETFDQKAECLRKTFFPPPPQVDLSVVQGARYPEPLTVDEELTNEEVREAIWRPRQDKAPGVNGIPNRLLRAVYEALKGQIRHLFQACFKRGYHPSQFKKANTVVLKKPKKPDYTTPKAYRPIALLDTLGKALETVISKKLRDCAEANSLLPDEQMGARKNRSVETALETITDAVHTVWSMGKANTASLLSLDVAGAFDNVSHERLLHNLKTKGVPDSIVQWTSSFLTDRATSITLGRRTSVMAPAETGIPQGSPISPILFLFFNAPLIEKCTRSGLPIQVGGFVDDVHLLAYGKSTEGNCRALEKAHRICLEWARTHGVSFAPQKYELVHLTRRPKRVNLKATIRFDQTTVEPKAAIRILGLHIDTKLRWGPHLAQVKSRMAS